MSGRPDPPPESSEPSSATYASFLSTILSNRDRFFAEVADEIDLGRKLRCAFATMIVLIAAYGLVVGAYSSAPQALSAAIKLPVLFLATFLICFPAFFVVQILVGSRLHLMQVLVLVVTSLALTAILLSAFVPIVVFFLVTGSNYYFLQLLHIVVVLVAGLFGMYVLHEGLSTVCETHGVYPKKAMTIMRVWAVIFAFVGIQMAWNLRPFLGDRGEPFQVFREYEGNFDAAIVYSIDRLTDREKEKAGEPRPRMSLAQPPSIHDVLGEEADSTRATGGTP